MSGITFPLMLSEINRFLGNFLIWPKESLKWDLFVFIWLCLCGFLTHYYKGFRIGVMNLAQGVDQMPCMFETLCLIPGEM